ncbi:MAG: DUF2065 domain-containing protein [Burkholderiales bacterium]|nr:DUF2065 domain-containing protein [Burkholderiales bacterium]
MDGFSFETMLQAVALVLVLEGLMPFISPVRWRQVFEQVLRLSDGQIRFLGLASILSGLVLILMFQ